MGGAPLVLTQSEWTELVQRMHGESALGMTLHQRWCAKGSNEPCVAIVVHPEDPAMLPLFLSWIVTIVGGHMEDLRFLADLTYVEYEDGHWPTYYIPSVTVAEGC